MYLDAEERKAELMKENKMSNNLMFKMDFDPRIIGNKILPDGTKKTGIGQFIRSTSLDEFPQFFNVINQRRPFSCRVLLVSPIRIFRVFFPSSVKNFYETRDYWNVAGKWKKRYYGL